MRQLPVDTRIPRDAVLVGITDEYCGLKNQVACGLCGTMHGKGVVVCFLVDGQEHSGIMGHVCGKKTFGAGFIQVERAWRTSRRDEDLQAAIDRFRSRALRVKPEIEAMRPALKLISATAQKLQQAAPSVFRDAEQAVKSQFSVLTVGTETKFVLRGRSFWLGFAALSMANSILRDLLLVERCLSRASQDKRELRELIANTLDIETRFAEVNASWQEAQQALEPKHLHQLFGVVNRRAKLISDELDDDLVRTEFSNGWWLPVRMNRSLLEVIDTHTGHWRTLADLNPRPVSS